MIRVLLVDDHPLFAEGLATLLRQQADAIATASICTDASQVLASIDADQPDLILLDINLGDLDGITMCRKILYQHPTLKIIAVTMHHELRYIRGMREAGARGYLQKNTEYKQVLAAIRTVYKGGTCFDEPVEQRIKSPVSAHVMPTLNPREKRILDGVITGKTSRQISEELNISLKTVEFYRSSLFVKFDVKNVVALINKARYSE
ncbi:MAG: response regulator transcription factor [Bacteroidetes bacterium]|nr:response regulator transcription factor [Fibrella sp.]